jgi:hypothetical protein
MKLDLIELIENEDGSADIHIDVDDEAKKILIQLGLETLLWNTIDKIKEESKDDS